MRDWLICIGMVSALAFANWQRGNGATSHHVSADPNTVYSAFAQSYEGMDGEGIASFGADMHIPYRVEVTRVPAKRIDVVVTLGGVRAWEVHYEFAPEKTGGTIVTGEVEVHQKALKRRFAGTAAAEKVKVGDAIYEFGLESELQRSAKLIEAGQPITEPDGPGLFDAEWEPNTNG